MSDNLFAALLISLLGMGIVFGIILLTWGIMAALTRIPPGKGEIGASDEAAEAENAEVPEAVPVAIPGAERAAAAAVAVALALGQRTRTVRVRPRLEAAATVSAWQSVMRGRQLKQSYRRSRR